VRHVSCIALWKECIGLDYLHTTKLSQWNHEVDRAFYSIASKPGGLRMFNQGILNNDRFEMRQNFLFTNENENCTTTSA